MRCLSPLKPLIQLIQRDVHDDLAAVRTKAGFLGGEKVVNDRVYFGYRVGQSLKSQILQSFQPLQ